MYENLLLDVVAHESNQNDRSYVRELSGFTFGSQRQNLAWPAVGRKTLKNHGTVKVDAFLGRTVTVTKIKAYT